MKLQPVTKTPTPSYPHRDATLAAKCSFSRRIRRAAIAVGTSAVLGLAACGGGEVHTETPDAVTNSEQPAGSSEPADSINSVPIRDEDRPHIRGGIRPPQLDDQSQVSPTGSDHPTAPAVTPTPLSQVDPEHIAGGLRPPRIDPPPLPEPPKPPQNNQPNPQAQNQPPVKPPVPVRLAGIAPAPRP